ncbi:MAG: arginine N-succinyltransferase [Thermodesulfobacteriota bacterium]
MSEEREESASPPAPAPPAPAKKGGRTLLYVAVAIVATAIVTFIVLRTYLFPSEFKPTTLSETEERVLDEKLTRLGAPDLIDGSVRRTKKKSQPEYDKAGRLKPERYTEAGKSRVIILYERELNALVAKDSSELAKKLAIDLSGDLVSAKYLFRVDEDFPIMAGELVRIRTGLKVAFKKGRPVVALKGVSVMGVPLPNSWLGGLKGVDLIEQYGGKDGIWQALSSGVEDIQVKDGSLRIVLKK